jgi:NADH dehydrogenase/NADH:ubiquinone oxidoreductase subunit G
MLNASTQKINLSKSSLCLLTGVNTRYESSTLNLQLRQRYLKGNFEILSFSSLVDLTFPKTYIGSDVKTLKSITEGNNIFCQKLADTTNPILILNSEIFKRSDTLSFLELVTILKNLTKISSKFWNGVNVLNPSLNDAGLSYITNVKSINEKDIKNSVGLYLINTIFAQSKLKKLVELKILNYLKEENTKFKILIEQNNIINSEFYEKVKRDYKIYNLINFSNNVFYETSGTYINSEGIIKKTMRVVSSSKKSKDDWKIIRKVFSYSKSILFSSNQNYNSYLNYNNNNSFTYKNFIGFHYYPIKNLTKSNLYYNEKPSKFIEVKSKFKLKKKKFLNTFIRFWLNDFYVGGKDFYSRHSSTMITCSKAFRLAKTNFY